MAGLHMIVCDEAKYAKPWALAQGSVLTVGSYKVVMVHHSGQYVELTSSHECRWDGRADARSTTNTRHDGAGQDFMHTPISLLVVALPPESEEPPSTPRV